MQRLKVFAANALVLFAFASYGSGSDQPPVNKEPQLRQVVTKGADGSTVYEYFDQLTGKKVREKTVFDRSALDKQLDEVRKRHDLAHTEADFDDNGEQKEMRWFNGLGKMYMKYVSLSKVSSLTTAYSDSGNRRWETKWQEGKANVHTAFKQDGTTVLYVFTDEDGKTPATCQVFYDLKGDPVKRQFTRERLMKSGGGISQGDPPVPYCQDTYVGDNGKPSFRQTWYWVWPDNAKSVVTHLGQIEVFKEDGKTIAQRIRLTPNTYTKPILRDVEVYNLDGSYTRRTYDIRGLPEKEQTFLPDGRVKQGRKLTEKDSDVHTMPREWNEGYYMFLG